MKISATEAKRIVAIAVRDGSLTHGNGQYHLRAFNAGELWAVHAIAEMQAAYIDLLAGF